MVVYSKRSEIERVQFPASFALIELIKKTRLTFEFSDSKTKFLTPSLLPFFFPLNFRVSDRSRIARVRFRFIHRSRDQQRTLISVLIYMRVSSESWLHFYSSKKEQQKKKKRKNNNHPSFIFDTDFQLCFTRKGTRKVSLSSSKGLKINQAPRRSTGWTGYYFYSP